MNTASPAAHVDSDSSADQPNLNGLWEQRRDILTDLGAALELDLQINGREHTFAQHHNILNAIAGSANDAQ